MNQWINEPKNKPSRDVILNQDWLKRWHLCGTVIAWKRSLYWDELIPLWSSFSDTRTLRKDLCLVWRLCPGNLPALMHEAVGLQFWTRRSHRDWIYLSTWNNYKKKKKEKMKYDFQTLGRRHNIVIPEIRKQVPWALWMPHLIPSKVSRLQLRKEQLKRHWCSPWVSSFATCRVD